jgi:hypothetical protein
MKAKLITKRYIVCPQCSKDSGSSADHLINDAIRIDAPYSFGPWGCNCCKKQFKGTIDQVGNIEIETVEGGEEVATLTLMVLPPLKHPMYFIVRSKVWADKDGKIDLDKSYFYDIHTCPTNWIGDVGKIVVNGDDDPHGAFLHVRTIIRPTTEDGELADFDSGEIDTLFPEMDAEFMPYSEWMTDELYAVNLNPPTGTNPEHDRREIIRGFIEAGVTPTVSEGVQVASDGVITMQVVFDPAAPMQLTDEQRTSLQKNIATMLNLPATNANLPGAYSQKKQ